MASAAWESAPPAGCFSQHWPLGGGREPQHSQVLLSLPSSGRTVRSETLNAWVGAPGPASPPARGDLMNGWGHQCVQGRVVRAQDEDAGSWAGGSGRGHADVLPGELRRPAWEGSLQSLGATPASLISPHACFTCARRITPSGLLAQLCR